MTPDGWMTVSLETVAASARDTFVDGPFGSDLKTSDYVTSGVRIIQLQNIGDGRFNDINHKYVSAKKAIQLARHAAVPGDIVIAKMADPVARACRVPSVAPEWLVVADCMRLRVDEVRFDPDFIVQAINSTAVRRQAVAKSTGSTRLRIGLRETRTLQLACPPRAEQRRIATTLLAVDDAIAAGEAVVEQLDSLRRGLLAALMAPHVGSGRQREWSPTSVGEVATDLTYGTSIKLEAASGAYPVLRIPNVVRRNIDTDLKYANLPAREVESLRLAGGDLLLVRTNGNPDNVGKSLLFPAREGTWLFASYLIRVRVDASRVMPAFLHYAFEAPDVRRSMERGIRTSAGNYNLNTQGIRAIEFRLPPLSDQHAIVEVLRAVDDRIHRERAVVVERHRLKAAIADALLTGKIRVPGVNGV
jgi:type I restriction enzyme S subunit